MLDTIIHIKSHFAKYTIFGNNHFYYKDKADFLQSGVSDIYLNLFYIRNISNGATKYRVEGRSPLYRTVKSSYRMVFQISRKIDPTILLGNFVSQLMQFECVKIVSFSDSGVYLAEYGEDKISDVFNLISIDFEVDEEVTFQNCECPELMC